MKVKDVKLLGMNGKVSLGSFIYQF